MEKRAPYEPESVSATLRQLSALYSLIAANIDHSQLYNNPEAPEIVAVQMQLAMHLTHECMRAVLDGEPLPRAAGLLSPFVDYCKRIR